MVRVMDDAPVASVDVITARSTEEPIGTIAVPMRDHMNAWTVMSLLQTRWPGPVDKLLMIGSVLTLNRNACLAQMRGDWILFIDDDMVWPPDAVERLVQSYNTLCEFSDTPIDMLAGLFCRRTSPYQPVLYMRESPTAGAYNFLEDWKPGNILEVDATGMAFTLITRKAIERFTEGPMPSYEERINADRHPDFFRWHGALGEDLRFCQDLKSLGGRIFVDTGIEIGHVGEKIFGVRDFWTEIALRSPEHEAVRRDVNTKMELPTLSARDARGRLGW